MHPGYDIRLEALRLAQATPTFGIEASAEDVVARAEEYLAFLDPRTAAPDAS